MATDVEESDTEDHERPAPPKRQCINVMMDNEGHEQSVNQSAQQVSAPTESNNDVLAREKFQRFQKYQIDEHCYMGSVDNTINRVMETYILTPPSERCQLRISRESEMEDRAVMMAIRNHGLVHTADFAHNSLLENSENHLNQWSNNNDFHFPTSTNYTNDLSSESICDPTSAQQACATSSKIFTPRTFQQFDDTIKHNNWTVDKPGDGDEQQDILERAVAEAIKIKGLSALSVDYG